jgi:perosamine synthetase
MFHPYVNKQARLNVDEVLRSRWIGEGEWVKNFEDALKKRFGFKHCLALNNGTAGLRLALAMCGVGPRDEVITTPQTCTATTSSILEQFATPVFADIQYETGNIDPKDIEHRITAKTQAIIVVHWAGYPCDMHKVHKVAELYSLPVIEDAAHALGAYYGNKPIGTISPYTMFSFQAIKQLTTADGGLLTLTDENEYHDARRRRWFGIDRVNRKRRVDGYAYWNQSVVGYKYHMNNVAAAIGLGNLADHNVNQTIRDAYAEAYRQQLKNTDGVTLFEHKDDRRSANWLFTMHIERRDDFCRMMQSKQVEVSVVHIRNDAHDIFGPLREDLPNTDRYAETNISIPLHNRMEWSDVNYVIKCVKEGW